MVCLLVNYISGSIASALSIKIRFSSVINYIILKKIQKDTLAWFTNHFVYLYVGSIRRSRFGLL